MSKETDPAPSHDSTEHSSAFLSLEDVKEALEEVFKGEYERSWANQAWGTLIKLGFAKYSNELERCEAAINFIAFAEFYKDWKANAEEGNREFNYGGVPTALNLIPFRLGQLIGRKSDFMDDLDFASSDGLHTDEQLFRNALFNLEIEARPNVVAALQEHYGGISGFFVELWN